MNRNTGPGQGTTAGPADDIVIRADCLAKIYRLGETPGMRLRRLVGLPSGAALPEHRALDGVSFTIRRGETVGLIGSNGAGKSTLLQIITGTLKPTTGSVQVKGRIAALLELGAGFNPEWTGRRNAEFQCVLQGVPAAEIPRTLEAIEAFADIGPYFDQPTRTYSSGMFLRVAFAAAVATEPDILIVDEALAVGDVRFQNKCYARFIEMQQAGTTILFVTHALEQVKRFCTRGLLMDHGSLRHDGDPAAAVTAFLDLLYGGPNDGHAPVVAAGEAITDRGFEGRAHHNPSAQRSGEGFATIEDFVLLGPDGAELPAVVETGQEATLRLRARAKRRLARPYVGWIVKGVNETYVHGSNTEIGKRPLPANEAGEALSIDVPLKLSLAGGSYFFDLGVGEIVGEDYVSGDWMKSAASITVTEPGRFFGIADLRNGGG
jgi:lipopolysaccharide transport system ATP-binding protein